MAVARQARKCRPRAIEAGVLGELGASDCAMRPGIVCRLGPTALARASYKWSLLFSFFIVEAFANIQHSTGEKR